MINEIVYLYKNAIQQDVLTYLLELCLAILNPYHNINSWTSILLLNRTKKITYIYFGQFREHKIAHP